MQFVLLMVILNYKSRQFSKFESLIECLSHSLIVQNEPRFTYSSNVQVHNSVQKSYEFVSILVSIIRFHYYSNSIGSFVILRIETTLRSSKSCNFRFIETWFLVYSKQYCSTVTSEFINVYPKLNEIKIVKLWNLQDPPKHWVLLKGFSSR